MVSTEGENVRDLVYDSLSNQAIIQWACPWLQESTTVHYDFLSDQWMAKGTFEAVDESDPVTVRVDPWEWGPPGPPPSNSARVKKLDENNAIQAWNLECCLFQNRLIVFVEPER